MGLLNYLLPLPFIAIFGLIYINVDWEKIDAFNFLEEHLKSILMISCTVIFGGLIYFDYSKSDYQGICITVIGILVGLFIVWSKLKSSK